MKHFFTRLFWPVLSLFEKGEEDFLYKSSHRSILIAVGLLFLFLASILLYLLILFGQLGALFPVLVFFAVGATCEIVGLLGSDSAVARIWKSRR